MASPDQPRPRPSKPEVVTTISAQFINFVRRNSQPVQKEGEVVRRGEWQVSGKARQNRIERVIFIERMLWDGENLTDDRGFDVMVGMAADWYDITTHEPTRPERYLSALYRPDWDSDNIPLTEKDVALFLDGLSQYEAAVYPVQAEDDTVGQ